MDQPIWLVYTGVASIGVLCFLAVALHETGMQSQILAMRLRRLQRMEQKAAAHEATAEVVKPT